jgi:S-(hydroxymethyl)glutathione dehydrogenase/alcohol dehydrogenase
VLKPGQVLVEIAFTGVCHTQLLEVRGYRGEDRFLPHCLGHEGSGTVREVGPGVAKVAAGDRVILSWMKGSGGDVPGTTYQWNGRTVNSGAIATFARYAVISENRLTPMPDAVDMRNAATLGCAIATGLGSVFNAANAKPGQSLVVFGAGGIGLCAVAGAAIRGCGPVVAVDVVADKLDRAKRMGASHVIDAGSGDPVQALAALSPSGVDIAIEASGRPAVMVQALRSVRSRGGTAVVVGNAHFGEMLSIDPGQLNQGKRLMGTWGGDNDPDRDFPQYCELLTSGRLDLAPLLSREYPLSAINEALDDLEAGRVARSLVDLSLI